MVIDRGTVALFQRFVARGPAVIGDVSLTKDARLEGAGDAHKPLAVKLGLH